MFCDKPLKVMTPPEATAAWLVPIWVAPNKSLVLLSQHLRPILCISAVVKLPCVLKLREESNAVATESITWKLANILFDVLVFK